jgi:hypothetical protein
MEEFCGINVHTLHTLLINGAHSFSSLVIVYYRYSGTLSEKFHSVGIIEMLHLSDEGNCVTAYSAAKAIKAVILRINCKGRRFFAMKRTKTL